MELTDYYTVHPMGRERSVVPTKHIAQACLINDNCIFSDKLWADLKQVAPHEI